MTPFTLRLTAGTVNVPSPLNSMTSLIAFGTVTPETMLKPVAANMYDPRRVRSLQLVPSCTGKPLARIRTMEEIVARELSTPSQSTVLLTAFALLALLLAALGIYGVLSYSVTQRTNEIGAWRWVRPPARSCAPLAGEAWA